MSSSTLSSNRLLLAGIDEAGLGPTLGPLVTACAAFLVPEDWEPDTAWRSLADSCARHDEKDSARITVADSKKVHRPGRLAELELAVGAFALLTEDGGPELSIAETGWDAGPPARRHPCYSGKLKPFPVACPPEKIARSADRLRRDLTSAGAAVARLRARALFEPEMNSRFSRGANKNQVLLQETGSHLKSLADDYPEQAILAIVDKQGGRDDYLPFLTQLFPGAWLETLEAGRQSSRYRVRRSGNNMEIRFQAKADAASFPTALASMAAKYARERAMDELNVWFSSRVTGLQGTAGYPEDARRWLREVKAEMGGEELKVESTVRLR